jgi:tetratricopeptide (TPR) repeat protein
LIGQAGQDVAAGHYEQALPTLQKVLQMEPGMPVALTLQGRCYFQLARYRPAKKCYQEILSRQPDNLNARFQMAACDYFLKDLTASEAGLKKVLEQDRNFADAHRYLGFLYQSQGKNSQALSSFQRVLELDAEDEDAHAKTGFLLAFEGHVKEAVPHFQKVIQLNPHDGEARFNLGVAYLRLKQEELARQELGEACRLDRRYCREPK